MFELMAFAIAVLGSFVCGLWDLKTTNIPDSVCIAMIVASILIYSVQGYLIGSFENLVYSLSSGIFLFIISYIFYKVGFWGGGDGELLVAIGMLIPKTPYIASIFPFSISFLLNSFIIGAFYSLFYSLIIFLRNKESKRFFLKQFKAWRKIIIPVMLLLSVFTMLVISYNLKFLVLGIFLILSPVLMIFAKAVEKKGFYKRIPVSKLKVDDMIGEDIPRLRIYKREIRGLTEKEVKMIKKNKKYVVVREGVRYGPVFFITLIFMFFFGDILSFFLYYI